MDRRNFLSAFIRGGVLVGLTATSGYLIARKGGDDSSCNSICKGCNTLPICTKDEAIKVKREMTKENK